MKNRQDIVCKIALSRIGNIGPSKAKSLIAYCGGAVNVFDASIRELIRIPGIGKASAVKIKNEDNLERAEKELEYCLKNNISVIDHQNEDFPIRLKQIDSCPLLLFKKGTADLNANRIVAIVGTRKPSEYGKVKCEKLIEGMNPYGISTISGLAYGIDVLCHNKCLEIGIPTIGVLGHGLDIVYPSHHKKVANKMIEDGALITYFQTESRFDRENFPARNRIVAAMCDVLVVVQSGKSGGSMITAQFANDFNRDVFAYPGRVGDKLSEGCNKLIKQHKAHLIETAEDVAYIMRWDCERNTSIQNELFLKLTDYEKLLLQVIGEYDTIGIDTLGMKVQKSPSQLASLLLGLEFKGVIKVLPGKKYMLNS